MNHGSFSDISPTSRETVGGFCYLSFQLLLLPSVLLGINDLLSPSMNTAQLNFLFYLLNFLAALVIFHRFLGENLAAGVRHPIVTVQAAVLGYAAYSACRWAVGLLLNALAPDFVNHNDAAILQMHQEGRFLVTIGTVILVPLYEECIFRGLIFRGLYSKSRLLAYTVSAAAFAAVHIVGYIGSYAPVTLLLAALQYLPAGLWLAWSYRKAGTIFAPVLVHAAVNFITLQTMR